MFDFAVDHDSIKTFVRHLHDIFMFNELYMKPVRQKLNRKIINNVSFLFYLMCCRDVCI